MIKCRDAIASKKEAQKLNFSELTFLEQEAQKQRAGPELDLDLSLTIQQENLFL